MRARGNEKAIREWLSPPDPSTNYDRALEQRHKDTGLWFIHGVAFKKWKETLGSSLWLHGIPGCGKTILSSTIIEYLGHNSSASPLVLYFYFDFSDSGKQTLNSMLRSLVLQVYQQQEKVRRQVDSLHKLHHQISTSSLTSMLRDMLSTMDDIYIVLDALDESTTRESLLDWLITVLREIKSSSCRLLVTSRMEEDIRDVLLSYITPNNVVSCQKGNVEEDVRTYVKHRIKTDRKFERWKSHPDLCAEIETNLMEKANGM
jgi:hypothetical protein